MPGRRLVDKWMARVARFHAERVTRRFERALRDAARTQDRLLAALIGRHADSAFGRDHRFASIRQYADFAARVPIRSYAEHAPYIDRVRAGETTALFHPHDRILMFALTSGTTASPKYIPITARALADCRAGWNIWGVRALLDHPEAILRDILQVVSPMNDHCTAAGIPCGAITGLLAATQKRLVRRYYATPAIIAGITDAASKYYTIMRLAVPRDVAWAVTANPATLLLLARTADEHREKLIRDVSDGTLSAEMIVEPAIRSTLKSVLRPDPQNGRRLETFANRAGRLYPRDYWRLDFLAHWTGGTMGLYGPLFPKYFGDVPARDIGLIASEGRISIPLSDGTASGAAAVTSQFIELIPAGDYGKPAPSVLRCHEAVVGEEYFLVLTNASGLFRYDIGDRVRVTGRMGSAPLIEFLSRDAHSSSMAGEKLTEDQVVMAMQTAMGVEGDRAEAVESASEIAHAGDFVLAPRFGELPWYRLYVETAPAGLGERFDAALRALNIEYDSKRKTRRLGPVEIVVPPPGTMNRVDAELRRRRSRTSEQFKHQYLLPKPGMDAALETAVRHESGA